MRMCTAALKTLKGRANSKGNGCHGSARSIGTSHATSVRHLPPSELAEGAKLRHSPEVFTTPPTPTVADIPDYNGAKYPTGPAARHTDSAAVCARTVIAEPAPGR